MKKTQVVLLDDRDGSEATKTVAFSFKGVNYEIDLSDDNLARFESDLAEWIGAARRTGGRLSIRAARGSAPARSGLNGKIREWAISQGMTVATRGRIPEDIVSAYNKAHS
ncbi:MAG: Lsr2 family protein [Actinomycetaceae bacterium]|nr:Lsr2 family protein [Actinomycetaceae bacterium]